MQNLKAIADETTGAINGLLDSKLTDDQAHQVSGIVEKAIIRTLLEGHHLVVDAVRKCAAHDEESADRYTAAIRREHDLLITNLSSLR